VPINREFLEWSHGWLNRIATANRARQVYDPNGLADTLNVVWRRAGLAALRGPDRLYAAPRIWRRFG